MNKVLDFFGNYTFGVFLIHKYLIDICIYNLGINSHSILFRVGGGISVFLISTVLAYIVKKIPMIKNII